MKEIQQNLCHWYYFHLFAIKKLKIFAFIFQVSQANEGRKLSGEEIQTCNLKYIVDAADNEQDPKIAQSKERLKAMKKRSKKIKTRMCSKAAEFEANLGQPNAKIIDAPNKAKIGKGIRDVDKLLGSQGKGSWPDSSVCTLERALGDYSLILYNTLFYTAVQ